MFGGDSASILRTRVIKGTDIRARFAAGELPQDIDTIGGEDVALVGKGTAWRSPTTTSSTGTGRPPAATATR